MKHYQSLAGLLTITLLMFMIIQLSGCGDSGYSMNPPFVISGIVQSDGVVSGTVYVRTGKRWDLYHNPISADGSYEISVLKHDPPYLVWAELNSGTELFSYSSGSMYDPEPEESDTTEETPAVISYKTVNINPLTDMVVAMALSSPPVAYYQEHPQGSPPGNSAVISKKDNIETLFEKAFISMGFDDGFNIFHQEYQQNGMFDRLLEVLSVDYNGTLTVTLIEKRNRSILFDYDLEENETLESMEKEKVDELIKTLLGITDNGM